MIINIWRISILSILIVLGLMTEGCKDNTEKQPKLEKANLSEIIAAMTLEEKALLVCGTGMIVSDRKSVV